MRSGWAVVGVLLMALVACSTPSSPTPASTTPASATPVSLFLVGQQTASPGTAVQWVVTATFSDGTSRNVSSEATWASSNDAVARVSSPGLITPVGAGSAAITAGFTAAGHSVFATAQIAVLARPELRCVCYKAAPGDYKGSACIVSVAPPQDPATFNVFADLTSLGGPTNRRLIYAIMTAWTEWDLDLHAPATPGNYPITFSGIDGQGRQTAPVTCQWSVSGS